VIYNLEQQAIIIDNQERMLNIMLEIQGSLTDLLLPITDRMTLEEKQNYVKAISHVQTLHLKYKAAADQNQAARIAYGIAPDPDDEAEAAELRALEEGNHCIGTNLILHEKQDEFSHQAEEMEANLSKREQT
jgi:hypothetical protein